MDQNAEQQHAALTATGCSRIFADQGVNGTRASRPELDKMFDHLRDGDEVVVWKLERLGRNTRILLALIHEPERRGVHFRSVTEGISTTGPMDRAPLTVMTAFAQPERDELAERTRAGKAAAAEHGRKTGRREVTAAHPKVRCAHDLKAQGLAPADIGKIIGASRATVYRYLSMPSNELPWRVPEGIDRRPDGSATGAVGDCCRVGAPYLAVNTSIWPEGFEA